MTERIENVITIDLNDIIYTSLDGSKEYIEEGDALAAMLATGDLFYNEKLYVNCSDVFAWGCADAEDYVDNDLLALFKLYLQEPSWGAALWCMIQRKERPQRPVEEAIRKNGKVDFDTFIAEHGLRPNTYDGYNRVSSTYKLELANAWRAEQGLEPVEYDVKWWDAAWKPYTTANPGWYSDEFKAEERRRINEWYIANGWEFMVK